MPMEDGAPVSADPASRDEDNPQQPDPTGLVGRLLDEVASLRRDFDEKIRYDAVKEQHIASMSQELEGYRAGLHHRLLRPLLSDLVALHDDVSEALDGAEEAPGGATLRWIRDSILETLLRNGVSSFEHDAPDVDTSRQKVIEVVRTADQELDRRIAHRLRPGFEHDDGKVLRPEWVAAYRYAPPADGQA
ncbi:hypothetical protein [Saccharopolyspora taberi]|uniref:Nucleotide exchange factor GrpE n=1 Tax=Saccharopolyspora taberi TaxID=60895 RepID=A0ABN3VA47_9PSEU